MKRQRAESRDQKSEDVGRLLRQVVPPIEGEAEPARDLWLAMQQRLEQTSAPVPWFDWALAAALLMFLAAFPATLPLLFYYL